MSRLIDKLHLVASGVSQPLGFRTALASASKPQMLIIASLQKSEVTGNLADHLAAADAVLLYTNEPGTEANFITGVASTMPDIPCGCYLKGAGGKSVERLVKSGCDFVVFPAASSVLASGKDDKLGRILQVESSLSDGLLRAINGLPVDAVLAEGGDSLSWYNLMSLQRFSNMMSKPLLVTIPHKATADEIKALWEAGVDGVVIEVSTIRSPGVLKKLRQEIGKLASSARKPRKAEALLPYAIAGTETESEPEEEEWEED